MQGYEKRVGTRTTYEVIGPGLEHLLKEGDTTLSVESPPASPPLSAAEAHRQEILLKLKPTYLVKVREERLRQKELERDRRRYPQLRKGDSVYILTGVLNKDAREYTYPE